MDNYGHNHKIDGQSWGTCPRCALSNAAPIMLDRLEIIRDKADAWLRRYIDNKPHEIPTDELMLEIYAATLAAIKETQKRSVDFSGTGGEVISTVLRIAGHKK